MFSAELFLKSHCYLTCIWKSIAKPAFFSWSFLKNNCCKLLDFQFPIEMSIAIGCICIMCIGIDRFIAVLFPIRYHTLNKRSYHLVSSMRFPAFFAENINIFSCLHLSSSDFACIFVCLYSPSIDIGWLEISPEMLIRVRLPPKCMISFQLRSVKRAMCLAFLF